MGQDLATGAVAASIYQDSPGGPTELALYAGLTLKVGASLAGQQVSITASPDLEVNTGSTVFTPGVTGAPATIPAHTVQVALKNAQIEAFGFTLTGSVYATASSGGFNITIPQSDPLTINFFNLATAGAYGYIDSDGDFSFTLTAGYDDTIGPFELYGSIGATISNAGFSAYFSGGANINTAGKTINIASAAASISIAGGYVDLSAKVTIASVPFYFNASLGVAPTPPSAKPGLQFYSVPTIAGAGQTIDLSAQYDISDSNGNGVPISTGDYQWDVSEDGSNVASLDGESVALPGRPRHLHRVATTTTSEILGKVYSTLLKQSTITVVDIPPTISTLGLNAAYTAGTAFVFNGTITAVNYSGLTYTWTVLKNGVTCPVFASGTTGNPSKITFTPDLYTDATLDHPLDMYTLTLTVSDANGGKSTATGSFLAVDSTRKMSSSPRRSTTSCERSVDQHRRHRIRRLTTQYGGYDHPHRPFTRRPDGCPDASRSLPATPGSAAPISGIDLPTIIDASAAPGFTIEGAPGSGRRLFYVAPNGGLTLRNVNVSGGDATGAGSSAWGGAIYDEGYLFMVNSCGLIGNSAVSTGTVSSDKSALGGAVYVGANAQFTALDSTFANNTAQGAGPAEGGAIYDSGFLYFINDTIVNNKVMEGTVSVGGSGSGVYAASPFTPIVQDAAEIDIYNTIVADNVGAAQDFYAKPAQLDSSGFLTEPAVDFDYGDGNLITSSSGVPATSSSGTGLIITSTKDPELGALAQRTDGIWSYDLLPGSPALNAGDATFIAGIYDDPGDVALDIQGLPRFNNGLVDIGAFEHQPSLLVTNANGSGPVRSPTPSTATTMVRRSTSTPPFPARRSRSPLARSTSRATSPSRARALTISRSAAASSTRSSPSPRA